MIKMSLLSLGFYIAVVFPALSMPNIVSTHVPQAEKVGEARLTVLFWDIYDATLYAPTGKWKRGEPLALKLDYLRDFKGENIAKSSKSEISKMGFNDSEKLELWLENMKEVFPDVKKGDSITGVYTQEKQTIFYKENEKLGVIEDPDFGLWFFDIWLGENTSEPKNRDILLSNK